MRKILYFLLILVMAPLARANQSARGWCEAGAQVVVTAGLPSQNLTQESFPQCTVTVFVHGGVTLATIYADNVGTPLANPYTASNNGQWQFYAANGHYDVQMSGAGFPTPVTYPDVYLNDAANQAPAIACTNVVYAASLAFNATNNACYTVTLTGGLIVSVSGTPANGNILKLQLYQNATGGNTVTFPGNFFFPAGWTLAAGANARNDLSWIYDAPNNAWTPLAAFGGTGGGATPGGSNHDTQCNISATFGPCVNNTVVLYVSPTGNDSSSGKTWDAAKLTIAGACAVVGNSGCTAGAATIYTTGTNYFLPSGTVPGISMKVLSNFTGLIGGPAVDSGPTPNGIDCRAFGCRALFNPASTITVTTNGTTSVSTTGISDFQQGDDLVVGSAGGLGTQTTPGAPTLNMIGATGTSSVSYQCVGVGQQWDLTAAGTAATVTTAPTVFGQPAVNISSVTWAANVVTVNTSTSMPFSSGTFHAEIASITSGGVQIGGIRLVTVVSSTQLTYSLTGSGTVTLGLGAAVMFVNGFVLTSVQETAGSNQIVLTTDVNHNFNTGIPGFNPTTIFIDGVSFPGELSTGFANGPYTITSTTSNTITVTTPYIATITQSGVASIPNSTAAVATMSVLTFPEVQVSCPLTGTGQPSTGGVYYAIYANYGSGYTPIGFTPWYHSIFFDRGPFANQGFVSPPAMNLPATPPVAAQGKSFEGKIVSISGSTLTLDRVVPASLTSVTGYHSNGISLQDAVSTACLRFDGFANQNFYNVIIPAPTSGVQLYYFSAPVDITGGASGCNRASIYQAGNIWADGTITSGGGFVEWKKPDMGFVAVAAGGNTGGSISITGNADPLIGTQPASVWQMRGITLTGLSNGQNTIVDTGPEGVFEKITLGGSTNLLNQVEMIIAGGGFLTHLKDMNFGSIPNPLAPTHGVCGNCGQIMWWPVPAIQAIAGPSNYPNIIWDGINYGSGTGIQFGGPFPGAGQNPTIFELDNVQTFQEPYQPMVRIWGNLSLPVLELSRIQMDSIGMPVMANIGCTSCGIILAKQMYTVGQNFPPWTGLPFQSTHSWLESFIPLAAQLPVNDISEGPSGLYSTAPILAKGGFIANPAPFDNFNYTGPSLASGWTGLSGYNSFVVSGNQVTTNASNVDFAAFYSKYIPAPDQFAEVTITSTAGQSIIAPFVRYNQTQQRVYICWVFSGTAFITLENTANQANTTLTSGTVTIHIGDIFRLEDIGTNLTCYQNGTAILTVSDSTIATGYPGIWSFGNSNTGDNWSGGNFVAQLNNEQDWTQPQHFLGPLTVGFSEPNATPGSLVPGGIYSSIWSINSSLCTDSTAKAITVNCLNIGNGVTNAVTYWSAPTVLASIAGPVTGQSLVATNGSPPSFQSPGIADGNGGSAITTTPYTIQCDSSTALVDRAHLLRFQTGAAAVTVPLSNSTGCASSFVTSVVDDGAGTLTFSRTGSDTFSIFNGVTNVDAATSFTLSSGQHATLSQGASGIWEVRIVGNAFTSQVNCAVNSASPGACGSAQVGAFVVPTTTTTYTVNTTAVDANSVILITPRTYTGNLPSSPTCVVPTITAEPVVSAIVAGTSFTITITSTTGQTCWNFSIFD